MSYFSSFSDEWSRDLKTTKETPGVFKQRNSVHVEVSGYCSPKSYDGPERAKWNDSEKRSLNGSWGKQPFGEKKSDNFSSRKNCDKKKDLVPGISVEGASTIYLKGILGPDVKCSLVYVPIGLATSGQINVHQQVL
ncbi:hypothetical protein TNCV_2972841 [Trichonephila clavipes]|nr:hypothetical protein TNCV_2972841 [Trichonephila clavipes]